MKNKKHLIVFLLLFILNIPMVVSAHKIVKWQFKLAPLPYNYAALEPFIDKETMIIHHDKHQQAYVDNLNKILQGHDELGTKTPEALLKDINTLPKNIKEGVINNAGGVYNHEFFWSVMGADHNSSPQGSILKAIIQNFESFDNFKEKFKVASLSRFGSGWAWLVINKDKKLEIITTKNQDTPISEGLIPLLALDLWEHAYYLKYQNRRGDYIDNWWNVVNWKQVETNFLKN